MNPSMRMLKNIKVERLYRHSKVHENYILESTSKQLEITRYNVFQTKILIPKSLLISNLQISKQLFSKFEANGYASTQ